MDETAWQLGGAQQFSKPGMQGAGQRLLAGREGREQGRRGRQNQSIKQELRLEEKKCIKVQIFTQTPYTHIRVTSFTGAVSDSTNFHYPILFIDIMVINSTILVL